MGAEEFSAESSLLYHRHSPSAIVRAEFIGEGEIELVPNQPLTPRHLRTFEIDEGGDPVTNRHPLLGNADVLVSMVLAAPHASPLYRNAVGDELVFVQGGSGVLETVFGALPIAAGDYVVVPTMTTHRWVPAEPLTALVVEASGHVRPPRRYLGAAGQMLEHAPYCERDLRAPSEALLVEEHEVDVLVKHRGGRSRHYHRDHPFDVVGWDGCLYPFALAIHDVEPTGGRVHEPSPANQTFELPNAIVCSYIGGPDAADDANVPYHHANVDRDEVAFYAAATRAGVLGAGSITLHPAGFVHGPQPRDPGGGAGEVAVMLDTFRPLGLTREARAIADAGYPTSWSRGGEQP
jgi:homogentisate 1,2-dioxygenase